MVVGNNVGDILLTNKISVIICVIILWIYHRVGPKYDIDDDVERRIVRIQPMLLKYFSLPINLINGCREYCE